MFKSGLFLALEYVLQTKQNRYSMFMYVSSLFQQEQRGLPTCIVLQMVRFQFNYKVDYTFEYMYITRAYLLPCYSGKILKDQEENLIYNFFFKENQPQQNKL